MFHIKFNLFREHLNYVLLNILDVISFLDISPTFFEKKKKIPPKQSWPAKTSVLLTETPKKGKKEVALTDLRLLGLSHLQSGGLMKVGRADTFPDNIPVISTRSERHFLLYHDIF